MHRRLGALGRRIATFTLLVAIGSFAGVAGADGWIDGEAAETTAGNLDDHETTSEGLDGRTAESRGPDSQLTGSENPDDLLGGAASPDQNLVDSQSADRHLGTSENLADLPDAAPDRGFEAIDAPDQSRWQPTSDSAVQSAREALLRAEQRAEAARTAYGDMRRDNYPTGEARLEIVKERDDSMRALEDAKRALAAVE